ncbi:integral membrane protein [Purpureocillium lavendulum]|uniref:Integral membrane protein n=1 Tax=Purpureocillium lavendulum TaxID=1247861 RepID=A0AB34FEW1_9HYPO|nr:integral membrane protein [Purpureocillium lavendulum]
MRPTFDCTYRAAAASLPTSRAINDIVTGMDTPAVPAPRDARERAILDRLVVIRDQLLLLKQDRTTYIRSQDVIPLYDQTIEQVKELNAVRAETGNKEENRLDKVLESCFQLLSLFYLTIGRNNEAPAAVSLTSTVKRLLDHLTEADLYSAKDLESINSTLAKLSKSISQAQEEQNPEEQHSPFLLALLAKRVENCQASLANLQKRLERIGEPLLVMHEKMISILRQISLANTKSKVGPGALPSGQEPGKLTNVLQFSTSEVQKLRKQLVEIGEQRKDGKFTDADGKEPKGGPEICDLYNRCLKWSDLVLERKGQVAEQWRPTYDALVGIRNDLEKLSLTQAWSLRETDLYDFQRQLDKIDENREAGNFYDERGRPADLWTQRTMLYLIRRSYAYIYSFMLASEPVSEALLPIYNQLQTLKRCLIEVKNNGGVSSVRELYPYSMKLTSLDNMRVDGKFVVNGDIPEGQGSVSELLAECFDINYDLRVAVEENASSD